jgi:hypothetical protein
MQMNTNRQMVTTLTNIIKDTNIKFLGRNDIMKYFILKKNIISKYNSVLYGEDVSRSNLISCPKVGVNMAIVV